ncbi:MAG: acyl-CoA dehydrogenase family protein [Acidimicrobiia bacterium]|nr:acyl-CoA dehydrogenase family protein [Acidimicrobiia bacterium]
MTLARERSAAGRPGGWDDPVVRQRLVRLWSEEQIRRWTNLRVRAKARANRPVGPESSIGKVVQGTLNQQIQAMAVDLLGPDAVAWNPDAVDHPASLPYEVHGMLRSRANTIEGGTTEVNKNILAERVLGLPREPDPWYGAAWREVPR